MAAHALPFRLIALVLLLLAEALALSFSFDILVLNTVANPWYSWLAEAGLLLKVAVVVLVALPLGLGPRLLNHVQVLRSVRTHPIAVAVHLLLFAVFYALSWLLLDDPEFDQHSSAWLPLVWVVTGVVTGGSWMWALAPVSFWRQLIVSERLTLALVGALAAATVFVALRANYLWAPLGQATFEVCVFLLKLVYADVIVESATFILGTADFVVQVGEQCSGYEGIALVTLFTGFYLSAFRAEFRFPNALILLPLGIFTIWLLNAVRITLLIIIGHEISPDIAIGGFHSQAGWIFFVMVSTLLLLASHRWSFIRTQETQPAPLNTAAALLIPLVVLLAMTLLTGAFSAGFDWLYPLRVVATGSVIIYLWRHFRLAAWTPLAMPLAAGVVVFVIWLLLVTPDTVGDQAFTQSLQQVPVAYAALWLVFRVIGSVVTVPIAEELAFRGYLMRRIGGQGFGEDTPLKFSWLAFLASSLLFGLLHQAWLAGLLAGLVYGLVRYHRDRLSDAIIAHATTNLLLFVYATITGHWSVW